jgi:hypothetical protein
MGLTNYLKNKLEKHPNTTKALNATKQGATKTYQYAKKVVNSKNVETIGRAAQGIGKGIDQGAGIFNNSLGFGPDADFGFGTTEPHHKHKEPKKVVIIHHHHEYRSRHERREHQHHRNHEHREKEWQLGDL